MSCSDIPSLQDLQNVKLNADDFGRLMGTGEGDSTNEVTGQTRPTYNKVMKSVGFKPGSGDFTTGFTVMPGERDIAWYDPVSKNWYSYLGVIPSSGRDVLPGTNPVGSIDWAPRTDETLRSEIESGDFITAQMVKYTPDQVPNLPKITIEQALLYRKNITDLGAVSGIPSTTVDARVVAAIDAGYCITLPHGFDYKTAGTLAMPSLKPVFIACPDGKATVSASVAGLMLSSPNTYKFQGSIFENISWVGFDAQNTASQWMYAEEGKYTSDFITKGCSWSGFHTVSKAACIAVKHYQPKYYGCGDTGAIADSYHWTTSLFSSFNLNEWHEPTFIGKFGSLFKILGGYSNYIYHPWFEKVETVSSSMILMRQHFNIQIIGGWLENFKTQFLFNLDGDGTENTQSDICVIDGLHINNNWSLDPAHSGQASGFVALFNRLAPANTGNQYDTKFSFLNIMEHPDSVVGWALTRTGSTLNLATSLHEFVGCRLKTGQPNASDGMSLAGNIPDLRRHFRDLSSNKLDLIPNNFQTISGRNTTGSQKDLVFDNQGDTTYFRRNSVKLLEWTTNYFAPGTANALQCGVTTRPWSGGFTQTAFTVTSDERLKVNIESILNSDDESAKVEFQSMLAAWREVDYFMYQLIDRVEAKKKEGKEARWHLGVIAQRAIEAFTRHGLDWTKYAIFNYDKWDAKPAEYDNDGNLMTPAIEAGDKYTINYEEAGIMESAARRDDQLKQEKLNSLMLARIEALENK